MKLTSLIPLHLSNKLSSVTTSLAHMAPRLAQRLHRGATAQPRGFEEHRTAQGVPTVAVAASPGRRRRNRWRVQPRQGVHLQGITGYIWLLNMVIYQSQLHMAG